VEPQVSERDPSAPEVEGDNRRVFAKLAVVAVAMFGFGFSQLIILWVVIKCALGHGEKAPAKPWDGATTLEWTLPSPAPYHTFETPPVVK
jgi:heme/copper-type cytochrome/quinol oxidase subunit 1